MVGQIVRILMARLHQSVVLVKLLMQGALSAPMKNVRDQKDHDAGARFHRYNFGQYFLTDAPKAMFAVSKNQNKNLF